MPQKINDAEAYQAAAKLRVIPEFSQAEGALRAVAEWLTKNCTNAQSDEVIAEAMTWRHWDGIGALQEWMWEHRPPEPDKTEEWRRECGNPDPEFGRKLVGDVMSRMNGKNTDADWVAFRQHCIRLALDHRDEAYLKRMAARHPEEVARLRQEHELGVSRVGVVR